MRKNLLLTLLCLLGLGTVQTVKAEKEIYGYLMNEGTWLVITYDENKVANHGVTPQEWSTYEWSEQRGKVEIVQFLESVRDARPTSLAHWFDDFYSLTGVHNYHLLNTEEVTDMTYLFNDCMRLENISPTYFNTSKVTKMRGMFRGCKALKGININSFDFSNVTDTREMFSGCSELTTIYSNNDLSRLSGAQSADMFKKCTKLKGSNGTVFDADHVDATYARQDGLDDKPGYFTSVTETYSKFVEASNTLTYYHDAKRLYRDGVKALYNGNDDKRFEAYSDKVFKGVIDESMKDDRYSGKYLFCGLSKMTQIEGMQFLNTLEVTNMTAMFKDCSSLTSLDLSALNTKNAVYMDEMFFGCSSLTSLDLSGFKTSNATSMLSMFKGCSSLTELNVNVFDFSKAYDTREMFSGCSALTTIVCNSDLSSLKGAQSADMFKDCPKLKGGKGTTYDAGHVDATYARPDGLNDQPGYFTATEPEVYYELVKDDNLMTLYFDNQRASRKGITALCDPENDAPLGFDDSYVNKAVVDASMKKAEMTTMKHLFSQFNKMTVIEGLENLNTAKVTDMSEMFLQCKELTSLDLSSFNTANVTNMSGMFQECVSLTSLDLSSFNTEKVTDMSYMFEVCESLTSLDLSSFNTANVTDMSSMFYVAGLTSLDLSHLNTGKVIDMSNMLGCPALTEIDLSPLNTENVRNMTGLFAYCLKLTSLDLSPLKTDNVESMSGMFGFCGALTSLNLSTLNTEKVTDMSYMFNQCTGLTSLDLSSFNTAKVETMEGMFGQCTGLKSVDLSSFNTANVEEMGGMFGLCEALTSLDLRSFKTDKLDGTQYMFMGCEALTTIYCNTDWTKGNVTDSKDMFLDCKVLKGGKGTVYDAGKVDITYARPDGLGDQPGYFTDANTHKVTFFDKEGNEIKTLDVEDGKSAVAPDAPEVEGYKFVKWDTDFSAVTEDLNIHPVYELLTFTVTFLDLEGKTIGTPQTVAYGTAANAPDAPEVEDFYFKEWDKDFSHVTSDLTVKAVYIDLSKAETTLYIIPDGTKLTVRYDKLFEVFDEAFLPEDITSETKDAATKIVFDESVKNYEITSLSNLCANMYQLAAVEGLKNINVTSLTDVSFLFQNCTSLTQIDLNGFDIKGVTAAYGMFQGCTNLKTIYCSADYTHLAGMSSLGMFDGCTKLEGGQGTKYSNAHKDAAYARPDGGTEKPGYFTGEILEKDSFLISVVVDGMSAELVNITGAKKYGEGDEATIGFELLDEHYEFDMWTWDDNFRKTETVTFDAVTENIELTLHFKAKNYTITVAASPAEGGTVNGAGTAPYNSVITLTAVPAEGWTFIGWQDDENAPAEREITVLGDTAYTALFKQDSGTGLENVQSDKVQCTKVLIDGQLYILRGEHLFDSTGKMVK